MTAQELRLYFYDQFNAETWPQIYKVDAETYGNVCQSIFHKLYEVQESVGWLHIAIGPNGGIMFKGVELILEGYTE